MPVWSQRMRERVVDDLVDTSPVAEGAGVTLALRGVRHAYTGPGGNEVRVLEGVDLDLPAGSHVAVSGRSGAGKTTLLSLLGGLERPRDGRVEVGGVNLASLGSDSLAAYRRETVGFVFQHFGLLETLTARENVELALSLAGGVRGRRRRRADELLDAVGLSSRLGHRPAAMSGGERQRVAIARALANRPRLVLADEPTGNLDPASADEVLELLERVPAEAGATLVVVTHNRQVAARSARRLVLEDGRLRDVTAATMPPARGPET